MRSVLRGELATAIRRALASVAIFAQVLLLFAPLIEVHDGDAGARVVVAAVGTSGAAMVAGLPDRTPPHNPTTCPACIAQSLHAQLASGVRLPTVVVAQLAPADFHAAQLPQHDPPSTHHSRAPPVVS
jgi:hypothetical protein